jgi:hypothetical protein
LVPAVAFAGGSRVNVVLTDDIREAITPLERLIDALLDRAEQLAERAAATFQEVSPSYARHDLSELTPGVLGNARSLLLSIRDPDRDRAPDIAAYRESGPRRGLVALLDGDLAGFVPAPISDRISVPVGVGPPGQLDALENSFRLATRALECAAAEGPERAGGDRPAGPAAGRDRRA